MKLNKRVIGRLILILVGVALAVLAYESHRTGLSWSQIVRRTFLHSGDAQTDSQKDPPAAVERETRASELKPVIKRETLPKSKGPGHDWTLSELVSLTQDGLSGRDFENGRRTFAAAGCIVCHRFDGSGGVTGPDLTIIIGRFEYKELAETIVEPSKSIPDGYLSSIILTTDGKVITGRTVRGVNGNLTVFTDAEDPTKVVHIPRAEVEEITSSEISIMPSDLLTPLNKKEVLDLLAYLMSHGNPADPVFRK